MLNEQMVWKVKFIIILVIITCINIQFCVEHKFAKNESPFLFLKSALKVCEAEKPKFEY